ncbi:Zinc finger MYM-type protein 1, partial [Frankliniella fusca]
MSGKRKLSGAEVRKKKLQTEKEQAKLGSLILQFLHSQSCSNGNEANQNTTTTTGCSEQVGGTGDGAALDVEVMATSTSALDSAATSTFQTILPSTPTTVKDIPCSASSALSENDLDFNDDNVDGSLNVDECDVDVVANANTAVASAVRVQEAPEEVAVDKSERYTFNDFKDRTCNQPPPETIPVFRAGDRNHRFQGHWYKKYPWLHYRLSTKSMVCLPCKVSVEDKLLSVSQMAVVRKVGSQLVTGESGVTNWKKADELFEKHGNSTYHQDSVRIMISQQSKSIPVIAQVSAAAGGQQMQAQIALEALIKSMLFLGRQGLAIRGSEADGGNFNALTKLLSDYCPELKQFLQRKKNFTSPQIQNEIAEIAAHAILRDKLEKIRSCEYYSLIMDEASDESTKEQMSIIVRTVNENLDTEEHFLGLYEVSDTTGQNLTALALDALTRLALPVENLRGQTYDGGSNMRGAMKGVQARIKEIQPLALYVHCFNHSLNLALQDTAKSVQIVRDSMEWTKDISVMIRRSPHRRARFNFIAEECPEAAGTNLSAVCPTRWTMRTPATTGILDSYPAVIQALEEIGETTADGAAAASGLANKLKKGSTYLGILICREICSPCEIASTKLQNPKLTVSDALEIVDLLLKRLNNLRTDAEFKRLWAEMEEKIETFELKVPELGRNRTTSKTRDRKQNAAPDHVFRTVEDKYRKDYFEALDKIIIEIKERFHQDGIDTYLKLERCVLRHPDEWDDEMKTTLAKYSIDPEQLRTEILLFPRPEGENVTLKSYVDAYRALKMISRQMFPNVFTILRLLLVVPATSASAERSFSLLRRLKTYLRTTMTAKRLNHLAVLHFVSNRTGSVVSADSAVSYITLPCGLQIKAAFEHRFKSCNSPKDFESVLLHACFNNPEEMRMRSGSNNKTKFNSDWLAKAG